MKSFDWIVLVLTLTGIVLYGLYKSRTSKNLEGYFLSNRSMPWWLVLLSIMGTQASAVTFLSAPGQAFTDGMRFVQYYFGLPLAMIVVSISFVPIFNKLKVFTAYEFLEQRFDIKTRTFTSAMFLLSRGFSTGISVYAPSIILSSLLGWDIFWTNIIMGGILIIYTVSGGAKAVAYTQQLQMIIIFTAMFIAGYYIVHDMPASVSFTDALKVSGASGKLNVITTGVDANGFAWKDKYNIISGLIGGFFLSLSYFGTDQSQVGRYLTAKNNTESKLGLLMNGLVKVPMQFLILLLGALLFTYYQFNSGPIFFNSAVNEKVYETKYGDSLKMLENEFNLLNKTQSNISAAYLQATNDEATSAAVLKDSLTKINTEVNDLRNNYKTVLQKADPSIDTNDTNYIFIRFVVDTLPAGLVGLLIAVIFLASWGSIAAALNSLASCTMIDFYCRFKKHQTHVKQSDIAELRQYNLSKWFTFGWGVFCIIIAEFSTNMGSLIQAVNEYGSLFYGVILGIFLVAFYMKKINGNPVFYSAIIGELLVIALYILDKSGVIGFSFLWLNVVGALAVVLLSWLMNNFIKVKTDS
ncbi:sodium:solute symporter [Panacibacter ginsenosidivorans]|uniref:Sodium:solute symporter n=1 Tax=Panacibacter ginsenosidivorans TaxID=1813871 RepID=A0A5B8V9M9_9BACT|nr:sodium:solute symporter [Panacibacter ginsenosidivorans]QEC67426.1 sodium:solute symporter [Panacibacter ginsenosidivorans]